MQVNSDRAVENAKALLARNNNNWMTVILKSRQHQLTDLNKTAPADVASAKDTLAAE